MDPLAYVSDHCHVSSSQKEMLNASPCLIPNLAPVSESEDEEEPAVVMMSVPDSSAEEEYRTPPERHSHSLTSSNEARVMEGCEDLEVNWNGRQEDEDMREKTVDLSRDSEAFGCSNVDKMEGGRTDDQDLMMEDGRVPLALRDFCDAVSDAEPTVEGNHGSSANPEMIRTLDDVETNCVRIEGAVIVDDAETNCDKIEGAVIVDDGETNCDRIEGAVIVDDGETNCDRIDELLRSGKDMAEEVERVTCTSTFNNPSLNVRKLPASICTSSEAVGAARDDFGIHRARTNVRDGGVERTSAEAEEGIGGADDGSGRKSSEAKEPNEDELTENILKVLGRLAKPRRPVYTEKVDIIGSAVKAGITFPRPSWWQEDSDDDSS